MIDSLPSGVANSERFERTGLTADAVTAARVRDEFAHWLGTFFDLDPTRCSDLILAINEALANSAEHAYPPEHLTGTTDLLASYVPADSTLTVTVADGGAWRMPDTKPAVRTRGRGIPLMSALADRADIETSSDGTLVSLSWAGIRWR